MTRLLDQLPKLSAYDPGAQGEGSLDPLGLAALAERLAERLVPGFRARMIHPHYLTLSAIGALVAQDVSLPIAIDGRTTPDIAFEWLTVEGLVSASPETPGLPGSQKARRAKAMGVRLSPDNYLKGPRVFGFMGVHRPLAKELGILDGSESPTETAEKVVEAWEQGVGLSGFVAGSGEGGRWRKDLSQWTEKSLGRGVSAGPVGRLTQWAKYADIASSRKRSKARLRGLIMSGNRPLRDEVATHLSMLRLDSLQTEKVMVSAMLRHCSAELCAELSAANAYEELATTLDFSFRAITVGRPNFATAVVNGTNAHLIAQLPELAKRVPTLLGNALNALERVDPGATEQLHTDLSLFESAHTAETLFESLLERHRVVQEGKGKRMWLEAFGEDYLVRPAYSDAAGVHPDHGWVHPMRLNVLSRFLRETG